MESVHPIRIVHLGSSNQSLFQQVVAEMKVGWSFQAIQGGNLSDLCFGDQENVIFISDQDHRGSTEWLCDLLHHIPQNNALCAALIIQSPEETVPTEYNDLVEYLEPPLAPWRTARTLFGLASTLTNKRQIHQLHANLTLRSQELAELSKIGVALSSERDQDRLLEMILTEAREITFADAGSLYLVEKSPHIPAKEKDFWADKHFV